MSTLLRCRHRSWWFRVQRSNVPAVLSFIAAWKPGTAIKIQCNALHRNPPCLNRCFRFIAGKLASICYRQVILSAGALGSPHLLLKNGIGAQKSLQDAGVQCIRDLPGVGENLQDHLQLRRGTFYMKDKQETSGYPVHWSSNTQHTHTHHLGCFTVLIPNMFFF